mgnify:CR=1 FL=1
MSRTKWEYKIVDHSNSTSMGYSNPETEEFKKFASDNGFTIEYRKSIGARELGSKKSQ